jgi:hypothetical protein
MIVWLLSKVNAVLRRRRLRRQYEAAVAEEARLAEETGFMFWPDWEAEERNTIREDDNSRKRKAKTWN